MLDLFTTIPEKPFQGVIKIQEEKDFNGIQKKTSPAVFLNWLSHVMLFRTAKI